jgi:hypothetical protein
VEELIRIEKPSPLFNGVEYINTQSDDSLKLENRPRKKKCLKGMLSALLLDTSRRDGQITEKTISN